MELELHKLDTDPALKRLVAPLNPAEFKEMEENIRCYGGIKGVMVWGNIILVDYEYYDYCHKQSIPFSLVDIPLRSEAEAVAWVCKNQLLRKFLPEEMRKYLIGRRSRAERKISLRQYQKLENGTDLQSLLNATYAKHYANKTFVRETIGKEYSLVYVTVRKYEDYAKELDVIYKYCPEFVKVHLEGRMKVSFEKIEKMVSLPKEMICSECQRFLQERSEVKRGKVNRNLKNTKTGTLPTIKDMPAADPDAEIVSLSLTIPSWRSSILRVRDVSDIRNTSEEARLRLKKALISLKSTTDKLLYVIRENSNGEL